MLNLPSSGGEFAGEGGLLVQQRGVLEAVVERLAMQLEEVPLRDSRAISVAGCRTPAVVGLGA
ncbi:hypothetical protein GCM10022207_94600 [Streptomyces lannensis]|uniref:Uncharacterized protein n=1 Tax=Streptomyces lannensis TaxID=766498 RepID=A0ABP7LYP0_9ACTN